MTHDSIAKDPRTVLVNEAVPFEAHELFFSRTDARGIILSGNDVFQRISQYEWEELLNKPHNVIRHPDMPKAVFWLLWETIKQGNPIGAYVKNRAKDGRYYWVFAIVTPIGDEYLSVRLKPQSELFPIVESAYKTLRAAEYKEQLKPAESGAVLLEHLKTLGFESYTAFMATALAREVAAYDKTLGHKPDEIVAHFITLVDAAQKLSAQAQEIFDAYAENQYVPLNLQVQAAQLGEAGATIGVISNNYNILSSEIRNNMDGFMASARQVVDSVNEGLFLVCVAKMQREMLHAFRKELEQGADDSHQQEMRYLQQQQHAYQERALQGLKSIVHQVDRFKEDCNDMKRLSAGLEVTRMMGKVESSRLSHAPDGLNELIDDLEQFQQSVAQGLKAIDHINQNVRADLQRILRLLAA